MIVLYVMAAVLLVISLLANREKTVKALRIALRRFTKIAPAFVVMLVLVAVALYLLPEQTVLHTLTPESRWMAVAAGLGVGSISVMPGFIAFPLCGTLLSRGAPYMALSAFSTALMMVGIVTFPLERTYLGWRLALARNVTSLLVALAVAVATGIFFGEIL